MNIDSGELALKLQNAKASGKLPSLWSVNGEEPLLAMEAADAIRETAREMGYSERVTLGLTSVSDWSQLPDCGMSGSLFDDKKIVEVRLLSSGPGIKGSKIISQYLQDMGQVDSVTTIFELTQTSWQTKKTSWYKELEAKTQMVLCNPVSRGELPQWISRRLRSQNQTIDPDALVFFAQQTEGNLLAAAQEIKKLSLLYPGENLTLSRVEECVLNVSRHDIDSLLSAIGSADAAQASRALSGMKAEDAPLPVITAMISGILQDIITAHTLTKAFVRPVARLCARRVSPEKAANALNRLADIDRLSKGIKVRNRSDAWDELTALTLFLCS